MKKSFKHLSFVTLLCYSFVSCSKSSDQPAPVVLPPKLLKEVKTVNGTGTTLTDSTITSFEYNEQYQLIKKVFKNEPNNYQVYEYNGNIPVSLKTYYNGNLTQSVTNFVTINGNSILLTFTNPPAPSVPDTVVLKFSFDGTNMTEYRTSLYYPGPGVQEYIQNYSYTGNNLSASSYSSIVDGVPSTQGQGYSVIKVDNKRNPYSGNSAMDKALMSIGQQLGAHGQTNVLELQQTNPVSGTVQTIEYTYDADGYPLSRIQTGNQYVRQNFIYTR